MNTQLSLYKHALIIGGGITGLSAAWYLQKAGRSYTLLEQSSRWGGKILTEQPGNYVLEMGPDAFLTRKPWALELAHELGLHDRIQPVNTENNRTFVLHRGQPTPLPDGLQLLVPTQWMPFFRSPLFSLPGKIRAALEQWIPARTSDGDETLANFVRRRLGAEMLDKLAEPLLGGVFNGDPEQQSMLATFPQFPALEKQHGSLIRGMKNAPREKSSGTTPPFISFKTGTHEIVDALIAQLTGDLRLNAQIDAIEHLPEGGYQVMLSNGDRLEADTLILATPAQVSAHLLRDIAPNAAEQLDTIPSTGIGTAYFAYRRDDVPHPVKGFGVVIPGSEKRPIDGVTWSSSKWNGRAPENHVLLRLFFGGPRTRHSLKLDDVELGSILRAELKSMFDISVPPLFQQIHRWQAGYPQYNLGHLERVTAAESALPPGVFIAGSSYRGVGVPDCVRQGRDAAKQAASYQIERAASPEKSAL